MPPTIAPAIPTAKAGTFHISPSSKETELKIEIPKRKVTQDLSPPPLAATNPKAKEILRVWVAPDAGVQLTMHTYWEDPGAWGIMLVDLAKHASMAYKRKGKDPKKVLRQIREIIESEWSSPTDQPEDMTDETR